MTLFFFWRDDFHTALTLIYWLLVFRLIAVVYHRIQPQTFNLLLTFVPVSMKHFVFESFLFGTKMILSISEDDKNWIMSVKNANFEALGFIINFSLYSKSVPTKRLLLFPILKESSSLFTKIMQKTSSKPYHSQVRNFLDLPAAAFVCLLEN